VPSVWVGLEMWARAHFRLGGSCNRDQPNNFTLAWAESVVMAQIVKRKTSFFSSILKLK
jgi:hypothetical protein